MQIKEQQFQYQEPELKLLFLSSQNAMLKTKTQQTKSMSGYSVSYKTTIPFKKKLQESDPKFTGHLCLELDR